MGPIRNPNWSTSGMRVTLSYLFDTELPWKSIWAIIYSNRANRKAKQLQFKLLHNIVYTEGRLQRMGLSLNGSCHFCKEKKLYYIYLYIVNLLTVSG
jgi:hypothetical protein